jgi:hypothetical protein
MAYGSKPLYRAFQQNRSLVEKWLRQEFPRISALARKQGATVFFEDEAGIRSDFHAGTTWAPRGCTMVDCNCSSCPGILPN